MGLHECGLRGKSWGDARRRRSVPRPGIDVGGEWCRWPQHVRFPPPPCCLEDHPCPVSPPSVRPSITSGREVSPFGEQRVECLGARADRGDAIYRRVIRTMGTRLRTGRFVVGDPIWKRQ